MKTTKTEATRKPLKLSGNMVTIPIGPDGKCPDPVEKQEILVQALEAVVATYQGNWDYAPSHIQQARAALQMVKGGE